MKLSPTNFVIWIKKFSTALPYMLQCAESPLFMAFCENKRVTCRQVINKIC